MNQLYSYKKIKRKVKDRIVTEKFLAIKVRHQKSWSLRVINIKKCERGCIWWRVFCLLLQLGCVLDFIYLNYMFFRYALYSLFIGSETILLPSCLVGGQFDGRSVCYDLLKGQKVTLQWTYPSTFFLYSIFAKRIFFIHFK